MIMDRRFALMVDEFLDKHEELFELTLEWVYRGCPYHFQCSCPDNNHAVRVINHDTIYGYNRTILWVDLDFWTDMYKRNPRRKKIKTK